MKAIFHGELANKFGKEHKFYAFTIQLLSQGLELQLGKQFGKYIREGNWIITIGEPEANQENAIFPEQVAQQFDPETTEVHFLPVVEGESNAARIIVGIVIMVVGYYIASPSLVSFGASRVLGGVVGLLAQTPTLPQNNSSNDPNYFFNGGTNTNVEGGPVPLVYGRVQRAGSVIISQGITVGQIS